MEDRVRDTGQESSTKARSHDFDPEPYRGELRAFLRRMGAAGDLDDVIQEAFLRAVRSPPNGEARAWLYRVALNLLCDRGRRDKRADRALPQVAHAGGSRLQDPAVTAENRDLAARAWEVIQDLPERQRAALVLRVYRQFTYREAAVALGCSEATARQHCYLGLKTVRRAFVGVLDD